MPNPVPLQARLRALCPALTLRNAAAAAGVLAIAAASGGWTRSGWVLAGVALGLWLADGAVRRQVRSSSPAAADLRGSTDEAVASVVDLVELPAVILDTQLRVSAFNALASELFPGLEKTQPVARMNRHPNFLGAVTLVSGDGLARVVEIVDHLPQGRRLRASVSPLRLPGNETAAPGLLVQFRDLSEHDRLAQMRSDFIANASHELRTPLASLRGFIETLQGPASNDTTARERFLAIMSAQSARMMRIIDDLLSLSRIEMRAHVPPTATVQINAMLREVAQGLEPIAGDAGIKVDLTLPDEVLTVRGDRDELVQVFQNLIQNAIKYGHKSGKVEISLQRDPDSQARRPRVRVVIADDGPGIASEHLPRLTERFYRVDTATSRDKGGTGLGLAIVKHILNRHRGDLKIASELAKGSTFSVFLDLAPARVAGSQQK
ncbi:MAG: ATP-binding protein [Hyphomicrobium sp.]